MQFEGSKLLQSEGIAEDRILYRFSLDLRYLKQYHEVSVEIAAEEVQQDRYDAITERFHEQHKNLYGYCLVEEATPVELINLRLVCIGKTRKPEFSQEDYDGSDPSRALKESRNIFMPQQNSLRQVEVFDGHQLKFGNRICGPALVEQVNTTVFVTAEYNLMVDRFGSYTMYLKSNEAEVKKRILDLE